MHSRRYAGCFPVDTIAPPILSRLSLIADLLQGRQRRATNFHGKEKYWVYQLLSHVLRRPLGKVFPHLDSVWIEEGTTIVNGKKILGTAGHC